VKILVTGADGFIGRNLCLVLSERGHGVLRFTRETPASDLSGLVAHCDAIAHLAGANRPATPQGFTSDNANLADLLASAIRKNGRKVPVAFTSSTQATTSNPYGASKRAAEQAMEQVSDVADVAIFRLPNVFGKWSRPFYNSAVATFCHQASRRLKLTIDNPESQITLAYIDDVVSALIAHLEAPSSGLSTPDIASKYHTTVGEVARMIEDMASSRTALRVGNTGGGLERALYATLLSHLPTDSFSYSVPIYGDARGAFVEAVKTPNAGQLSYFTQVPGVERGGHYHHSKSEKFLIVKGKGRFRFRHLTTGERVDVDADSAEPRIVDTIPGWVHDVQNLGNDEMIVLVWANEVFDRDNPDTFQDKISK
jgi:UDP-2-acetamido-2,6-beta-L-arabino-hexul-4-ose reductase